MALLLIGGDRINGIFIDDSAGTVIFVAKGVQVGGFPFTAGELPPGSVDTTQLANGAVIVSKMAALAAHTLLGNKGATVVAPAALTVSDVQTLLGLGTAAYAATGDFDASGAAAAAQASAEAASDPVGSASTVANSPQVTGATQTITSTIGTVTVNLASGYTSYTITLTESVVVSFTGTTTQKIIFSVVGDGSSTLSFDGTAAFSTDLPSFTLTPASGKVSKVAAQYDATVGKVCILASNGVFG